jgi:hypothetical protein
MTNTDRCCRACKSSFPDVCHKRRDCWCHIEARLLDRSTGPLPYRDPTPGQALGNIAREERKRKKRKGS